MDLSSFHNQFRDETAENLRVLADGLMALEGLDADDPARRAHVDAIFRAVHTVKGGARLLGFEAVGNVAHTLEHILGAIREGRRSLDRALADELLRGGDAIGELTLAVVDGRPTSVDAQRLAATLGRGGVSEDKETPDTRHQTPDNTSPSPALASSTLASPTRRPAARQTVRVRVDRLDRLITLAGELALGHQVQVAHVQTLSELQLALATHERALTALSAELARLRFSPAQRQSIDRSLATLADVSGDVRAAVRTQVDRLGAHNDHHGLLVGDLEQEVMSARLLPVATVFANLPRAVRELSASLGKEAALVLSGEATELDRKLLEALADPLTHLLRNALDHGIEPPHERSAQGKPAAGQVNVTASAVGNEVHVAVADDGRGMVPELLRESAVRKGLIAREAAAALTDQEALELIFLPGFSTAAMITDVSGRGVGMDVVRTNITELGGHVQLESRPGLGTTITLVLPLTLVTSRVLLITLAGQTYALPASGCHGIIWAQPDQVEMFEGNAVLRYENATVPLLRMADVLGVAGHGALEAGRRVPAVLIGNAKRPIGLLVDRLDDEREVVVKPLGPLFERQRRYGGAVQLGDGRLVLLLNPVALAQEARGMARPPTSTPAIHRPASRLLVADDSFTTRELIRSILQSAGYDVTAAVDGHDALDKLRAAPYDLLVSDVEMPRVSGLELTARLRRELQLTDLPVILVTSLASDEHKRKGLEAGAQAYIVKSQFNQDNLLEAVRQLLGR